MLWGLDPLTKIKVIAFLEVNLMDEFHTFECKHCEILHSLNVSLPILYFQYIFTKPRSTYVHKLISYVSSRFTICVSSRSHNFVRDFFIF